MSTTTVIVRGVEVLVPLDPAVKHAAAEDDTLVIDFRSFTGQLIIRPAAMVLPADDASRSSSDGFDFSFQLTQDSAPPAPEQVSPLPRGPALSAGGSPSQPALGDRPNSAAATTAPLGVSPLMARKRKASSESPGDSLDPPLYSPAVDGGDGVTKHRRLHASPAELSAPTHGSAAAGACAWRLSEAGLGGTPPAARWGHSATEVDEGRVVVYGGQADNDSTLGDLHVFDAKAGRWKRPVSCDSYPRAWHTCTFVPRKRIAVAFGGQRQTGEAVTYLDQLMVLDTEMLLWYPPVTTGDAPPARAGHSACLVKDCVVIFGGCRRRGWSNDLYCLDTTRWCWERPSARGRPPAARVYHAASVLSSGRVVFFGGNNDVACFNDVHVLAVDGSTWTWEQPVVVGVPPAPRTGHLMAPCADNCVLVHGGWDPQADDDSIAPFADLHVLDTVAWEWRRPALSCEPGTALRGSVGHRLLHCTPHAVLVFGGQEVDARVARVIRMEPEAAGAMESGAETGSQPVF